MYYISQLRFRDLDAAVKYYTEVLGCELGFRYEDFYAGVKVGDQMLHLKLVDDRDPGIDWGREGDHVHLMFVVEDVAAMRAKLLDRGANISEVRVQPWGSECTVVDPEGHALFFSQLVD